MIHNRELSVLLHTTAVRLTARRNRILRKPRMSTGKDPKTLSYHALKILKQSRDWLSTLEIADGVACIYSGIAKVDTTRVSVSLQKLANHGEIAKRQHTRHRGLMQWHRNPKIRVRKFCSTCGGPIPRLLNK